jgi:hypothetical protein
MGLDAVELLLEIEEEFGISVEEDEAAYFRTLGNVHDYLLEKCAGRKRPGCPTRSAFYRLRRALGVVLEVEPRSLRPTTPLLPLLGRWRRRNQWCRLQQESDLELPSLENRAGAGTFWGSLAAGTGTFLLAAVLSRDAFVSLAAALTGLLPGVLLGYVIGLCWPPTVGRRNQTLAGLARQVVALNDPQFRDAEEPPTQDDPIWDRLCAVLAHQTGVRRESLTRHTRFVEDLGF